MTHLALYAQWTGYTAWFAAAWAVLTKTAAIADRFMAERRRRRNARRLAWRTVPRPGDPGSELTRVLPAIQRPEGPGGHAG